MSFTHQPEIFCILRSAGHGLPERHSLVLHLIGAAAMHLRVGRGLFIIGRHFPNAQLQMSLLSSPIAGQIQGKTYADFDNLRHVG